MNNNHVLTQGDWVSLRLVKDGWLEWALARVVGVNATAIRFEIHSFADQADPVHRRAVCPNNLEYEVVPWANVAALSPEPRCSNCTIGD